jgi:hypothetical protein
MSVALTALSVVPLRAPGPSASPTPGPTASAPAAGTAICTVTDPRAIELSGLVATPSGYVAINDSNDDPSRIRVFYLDPDCRVTRTLGYPTAARDPEDLAQAPDGTLWVSDTGDNITSDTHRSTIALWHVPANGGPPVIYRLAYPDGSHDAEALFFTPAGTPVIVTKEILGTSGIYEPAQPLQARTTQGVPLKRVGQFTPTATGVPNPLGLLGETLVTGAATSPDRKRVALRTYSAAYEWDVPDGDPVKAITTGTPRVTPLPNEPQGESIAYTVDGSAFLTLSDREGPTTLLRYTPTAPTPARTNPPTRQSAVVRAIEKVPGWVMMTVAVGGLGLAVLGVFGLIRGRRRA